MILQIFGIVLLLVVGVTILVIICCLHENNLWIFSEEYWIYKYGVRHPAVKEKLMYFDNQIIYLQRKVDENEKVIKGLKEELRAHAKRLDNLEKDLNRLKKDLSLGQ